MKTTTIEIPEGKRAEWIDGVLTLVDEQPVEFKFKVGDKVIYIVREDEVFTINKREILDDKPHYFLVDTDGISFIVSERFLEPYVEPQDITERIKTFEDACKWCKDNDKQGLYEQYADAINVGLQRAKDILAYLKLRIITCALNEGWEPTFEKYERRWYAWEDKDGISVGCYNKDLNLGISRKLIFKSSELAEYAATQFRDIYMDFCYKGKE